MVPFHSGPHPGRSGTSETRWVPRRVGVWISVCQKEVSDLGPRRALGPVYWVGGRDTKVLTPLPKKTNLRYLPWSNCVSRSGLDVSSNSIIFGGSRGPRLGSQLDSVPRFATGSTSSYCGKVLRTPGHSPRVVPFDDVSGTSRVSLYYRPQSVDT